MLYHKVMRAIGGFQAGEGHENIYKNHCPRCGLILANIGAKDTFYEATATA